MDPTASWEMNSNRSFLVFGSAERETRKNRKEVQQDWMVHFPGLFVPLLQLLLDVRAFPVVTYKTVWDTGMFSRRL